MFFQNADKAVKSGMALNLDIRTIDQITLAKTIKELLTNKKYMEAAQLRSRNFQDQKEKPMERALWWIDYVARNPDVSFLRSSMLDKMNYFYKHSIDVIAFLTLAFLGVLWAIAKIIICLICRSTNIKSRNIKVKSN